MNERIHGKTIRRLEDSLGMVPMSTERLTSEVDCCKAGIAEVERMNLVPSAHQSHLYNCSPT